MLTINNGINSKSVWDICGSFGEFNAEVRAGEIFENGITVDLPGRYSCVMTSVTTI